MASAATRGTHYCIRDNRLVRTLPRLVVRGAARTPLDVVLAQRSIELSQLSQLHPTEIVVALWYLDTLPYHVLDLVHCLPYCLRIGCGDERMQGLVLARQRLAILASHLALLHRTLAANYDLGARILLHGLERVAARPDEQAHEINVRMLFLRDQHLVADTGHWRSGK